MFKLNNWGLELAVAMIIAQNMLNMLGLKVKNFKVRNLGLERHYKDIGETRRNVCKVRLNSVALNLKSKVKLAKSSKTVSIKY